MLARPRLSPRRSPHRVELLDARARAMRNAMTPTEAALWRELSGSRLGVAFRRQVVLGECIVDFCCPEAGLVVEVDGGYHVTRARADARRARRLEALGYRVLRLPAELVRTRPDLAARRVQDVLDGVRRA